jgi:hypothetical protein
MRLIRIFSLPVEFLLKKAEEVVLGDVFELISASLPREPLEDLFKGILSALLVRNVVAVSRLLIELSERVCCLLEADLQTI